MTSEKRTSSEELENARGSSERSFGREAKRGPDEGAELWHLMGMKYKMSDGGYDDINEESDDGPKWGRVNRVHEPVIPKDDMIFDGIKYDVIKEGDGGLDGWQVSEAHEPIVPKDMILELWNNEIKIDQERDRDLMREIEIDREGDRDLFHLIEINRKDRERMTYMEPRWQSAAAA